MKNYVFHGEVSVSHNLTAKHSTQQHWKISVTYVQMYLHQSLIYIIIHLIRNIIVFHRWCREALSLILRLEYLTVIYNAELISNISVFQRDVYI